MCPLAMDITATVPTPTKTPRDLSESGATYRRKRFATATTRFASTAGLAGMLLRDAIVPMSSWVRTVNTTRVMAKQ